MAKYCVFCGGKPDKKTKEHVIPRWLIELTGDPNRKVNLGFVKDFKKEIKFREFAFSHFTFPACQVCNAKYAELESKVKPILVNILDEKNINTDELNVFLDWLDKVRVGLWLGMNLLDKNYADVDPNFHIENRIAQYDRLLIIEKSDSTREKLNFGGVDNLAFSLMPSAFLLVVGNYYFTNISYMFLFHRRLGFPFPKNMYVQPDDERLVAEFSNGINRIMYPLLRKPIKEKGIVLYQPMFRRGLVEGTNDKYNNDYVTKHSMNFDEGVGNIFIQNNGKLNEYSKEEIVNLTPAYVHEEEKLRMNSAINIREWQNWLTHQMPSLDKLSVEQKKYVKQRFKTGVLINNLFIRHIKESLLKTARK